MYEWAVFVTISCSEPRLQFRQFFEKRHSLAYPGHAMEDRAVVTRRALDAVAIELNFTVGPAIVAVLLAGGWSWKWLYAIAAAICSGLPPRAATGRIVATRIEAKTAATVYKLRGTVSALQAAARLTVWPKASVVAIMTCRWSRSADSNRTAPTTFFGRR